MPRPLAIIIRLAIALVVIALSLAYYAYLVRTKPEPPRRPAMRTLPVAEVLALEPSNYPVILHSQGIVRPRTQTQLTAEVSGKIARISDSFLNGAAFEEGEVLIELDDRDYQTAEKRAHAALTRARTALQLAQAQTDKARQDWERLGLSGEPNDLALRLPQLKEAEADVEAAEADLAEAQLNVSRCRIVAPYHGRVVEKMADVGQYVSPGTALGQIYSSETFEVRLPLRDDQLAYLELDTESPAPALLKGERANEEWAAVIERTDASVDERTRQLFVIAAIDATAEGAPPLPSGTYVEAEISGDVMENVFVIPREAVRGGDSVLRVTEERTVEVQSFEVVYDGDPDYVIASTGGDLKTGDRISITPLPFVDDGAPITIKGEGNPMDRSRDVAGRPAPGEKGKGKGESAPAAADASASAPRPQT